MRMFLIWIVVAAMGGLPVSIVAAADNALKLATFDIDATPPVGSMMAYDRVKRVDELGLRARGIVLQGSGAPIVLCAVDWIGIGNEAHDVFRNRIAKAAGTTAKRVAVHTLHQHDAPRCDFSAEALLNNAGTPDLGSLSGGFAREVLDRLQNAIENCLAQSVDVSHVGFGSAEVEKVASNRRLLGEDGNVQFTRYTTCRDPKLRAMPEGVVDRELNCIAFYDQTRPVAVLTYYACHPQSYYRTGVPSPDFPGIARFIRGQDLPDVLHLHFNGAGGNIGAGKYNDGSKANRMLLAGRLAEAMKQAFERAAPVSVSAEEINWKIESVALPPGSHLDESKLREAVAAWDGKEYWGGPVELAFLLRCQSGHEIDLGCLSIGDIRVLHMPGELFVEYQLAAKAMRPDLKVAMAAYGDYGPGYIGTEIAYGQGGYETSERASKVSSGVEGVLKRAMASLLDAEPSK